MSTKPAYYTIDSLATELSIVESTVTRFVRERKIPQPFYIGRMPRWKVSEIEAWVDAGAPSADEWEAIKARQAKLEARGLATNTK